MDICGPIPVAPQPLTIPIAHSNLPTPVSNRPADFGSGTDDPGLVGTVGIMIALRMAEAVKAKTNGEDVITPLIEQAATRIVAAVSK